MSNRAVIIASFITLTVEHALCMEPDLPPLLSQQDYGTFATKQQSRSLKRLQLLQEKFREKNVYVWSSLLFVFRACCICVSLLLLPPLIFIARDMKHLRLKTHIRVLGTIWQKNIFWATKGNKNGGCLSLFQQFLTTGDPERSETINIRVWNSTAWQQLCIIM